MYIIIVWLLFCFIFSSWGDIQFEDVSHQAGITRIGESWGNAWGDFDGDGYLDLWATNHRHKPSLYRNNGDGTFTDIIDEVWDANPTADTHGVAWADFDNDSDQDLIILSGASGGSGILNPNHHNHFYVNENGFLHERAVEFGLNYPYLRGRTPLWFDSDRDGRLDVLLTGYTGNDRSGNEVPMALFGQTMNRFENIRNECGCHSDGAKYAQYADITNDGNMEIILSSYGRFPLAVYDTFISPYNNILSELHIPHGYYVLDTAIADFNGDLLPDFFLARGIYPSFASQTAPKKLEVYVSNSKNKGVSFKSDGELSFRFYSEWFPVVSLINIGSDGHSLTTFDGSHYQGVTTTRRSAIFEVTLSSDDPRVYGITSRPENNRFGISVGFQKDTNKWMIIYEVSSASTRVEATETITELETFNFSKYDQREQPASQLIINEGNKFQISRDTNSANNFENGVSVAAGDFDNDMDIDLYLVRSISTGNVPNHLYENQGNGTFIKHSDAGGANGSMQGQGKSATMADYDRDGFLDLFVTNGKGAYPINEGPDQLYRNISSGNNWIQIDLEGTVSNRDGIGTRILATTPDGKTQLRENGGGIHWDQQDQKRIHFGLAQNEKVSELVIYWPSGLVQKLKDVGINQVLHVVEENTEYLDTADVNMDGQVDIFDFLIIVAHIGESPPSNPRHDINKDRVVDLEDIIFIVEVIENENNAAPTVNSGVNATYDYTLADVDIELLSVFYEIIEEYSVTYTQKALVRRFLESLLKNYRLPLITKLYANYPNPFNPETWIPYQLGEDSEVSIYIYDTTGKIIRRLFTGHQVSGYYINRNKAAHWDGRNESGEAVSSGIYMYKLETPSFKQTRKLVIIK